MAIKAGDVIVQVGAETGGLDRGMDKADRRIGKSTDRWRGKMKMVGMAMVGAAVGIAGASLKMASDFDSAMRQVNTMMLLSEDEFKQLSEDVREFSKALGQDAVASAEALYQAISAGVPKENVIEFMQIATKAAIGGATDTATAVDGLTTVLNAFKMPMSDAQKVADIMFTTVKGGKTTFEELSASMSLAAPIAATLGVKFEDVMATIATLTKQGVPTSVAFTQIKGAMVALMKPTSDMNELLEIAGFQTGEAMLQTLGFAGTMDALRKAANNNNEVLAKAFGRVEGLNAVLGVTGANAEMAALDIDSMTNSAGAATDAFAEMEKTTEHQMNLLKAQLKDTAITLGNALIPMVIKLMNVIIPLVKGISNWVKKHPKLALAILALVGVMGVLIATQWLLNAAMLANPIGLIVLGIVGLIFLIKYLIGHMDEIKAKFTEVGDVIREKWGAVVDFFTGIPDKIRESFQRVKDFILAPFRAAAEIFENIINYFIRNLNKLSISVPGWVPGIGGKQFGFNLQEVSLPKWAHGGVIDEPTLLYGLKSQRPYAIVGEAGPERVGGGDTFIYHVSFPNAMIRKDADLTELSRLVSYELRSLQDRTDRRRGVIG